MGSMVISPVMVYPISAINRPQGKGQMYSAATIPENRLLMRDCSELNALSKVVGWDVDYTQQEAGDFDGTFAFGLSETLRIGCPSIDPPLLVRGTPPPGSVALLLPETDGAAGIFQGQDFGYGQAAIMCPGSEGSYRTPARHRFNSVCIPVSRLRPVVEQASGCPLDPLISSTRIISLAPHALQTLRKLLQQALTSAQATPIQAAGNLLEIEQHIVGAMALALTAEPDREPLRIARRLQVFERARAYIEANLANPLGLEILALETGVSLRTLRYSFNQVLGINPLQYIKLRRLGAARRLLLEEDPGELSVTTAAMRCGFSHMSYFARDYRALFGELPAQTLGKRGPGFNASWHRRTGK
jgi:AraC family transcriptional regulator, ethanolamine operon transcriptional activator